MTQESENMALEEQIDYSKRTAELLPQLVELLQELPAMYRNRLIRAAMILLKGIP